MRLNPSTPAFTILLGVCAGLPALSIDLSAPTLTILPDALETTMAVAGLSLSLFMLGFAVGQFVGGRMSDRLGRRPVLLMSITLYILSAGCCSIATSGLGLVASRLIQGLGAGACAVQASAMVQDLFHGEVARRKQSYVSVVLMIMPMLAPALGTFFVARWGWRSVHLVLAVAGVLLAAVIGLFVQESRSSQGPRLVRGLGLADSAAMLRDGVFRRLILVNAFSYGAIFAYIAGAPVVVMSKLGQTPSVYAALFAGTALALSSGSLANAWLGRRGIPGERLVWPGLLVQGGSTLCLVLVGRHPHGNEALAAVPALLICAFARGLLSPNLVHLAVSRYRDRAGLASAQVGLMQLLVGALASAVVAASLSRFGYRGVAVAMAVLACSAAAIWWATEPAEQVGEKAGRLRPATGRGDEGHHRDRLHAGRGAPVFWIARRQADAGGVDGQDGGADA